MIKDILYSSGSLFKNREVLDYDYNPKIIKFREKEQKNFAYAIKPLLENSSGKNLFIYGNAGVGKTLACRHVLNELDEFDIDCVYINCWENPTLHKIFSSISRELGSYFNSNLNSIEMFSKIKQSIKRPIVFIFDEIDKLQKLDYLYYVLEFIPKKTVFLVSNYRDSYKNLDSRIRSRLTPDFIEFKGYNFNEIKSILSERINLSVIRGVITNECIELIADKTMKYGDLRLGLYLVRELVDEIEKSNGSESNLSHVKKVFERVDLFHIGPSEKLDPGVVEIFYIIRDHPGIKIGDCFKGFSARGGDLSYKTFTRRIKKLVDGKYIYTQRVTGSEGNTTLLYPLIGRKQ